MMGTAKWIFLYLLVPIILGILGNLITPWIKSYLDKGSLSIRDRALYLLYSRYDRVKKFKLSRDMFGLWMIRRLASGIFYLTVVALGIGIYLIVPETPRLFSQVFAYVGAVMAMLRMNEVFTIYSDVIHFEDFKKKTVARYEKLGGNPEDLDKEETA